MKKKILVLEDDEATAELIKFYLKEEGYDVELSLKGENFVERAAEYHPDLITIDILLPDSDGFKIFSELGQDEHTKHIPVIFITVKESKKKKGLKMGAQSYIVKPFKEEELKETVKDALRGD